MIDRRSLLLAPAAALADPKPEVWNFDRLDSLGGHRTTIEGQPRLISTPKGKAIEFDGAADAILLDVHPLAEATQFTWEVIFKPYSGGRPEQRFFHLQENGSVHRYLMETRLAGNQWCLDTYAASKTAQQTLIDRSLLHSLDEWHHVALVYDGYRLLHYVDHQLEVSSDVRLTAQSAGRTSIGVRINRVDYFKGAILRAVFHRKALQSNKFQKW